MAENPFDSGVVLNPFDEGTATQEAPAQAQAQEAQPSSNPFDTAPQPTRRSRADTQKGSNAAINAPSLGVIGYNWKAGYAQLDRSLALKRHNVWSYKPNSPEYKQALQAAYTDRLAVEKSIRDLGEDPTPSFDRKNWMSHMVGKSAKILPFMLESIGAGAEMAMQGGPMFAMGAAAITPGPPQVKMAAMVPAFGLGIRSGMTVGQVKYSMDVEGGDLYWEMIDRGIDADSARNLAMSGGLAIGMIETLSNPLLEHIPGLKNLTGYTLFKNEFMNKVIGEGVKKYALDYGIEIGEEGLQEITGNTANLLADIWDGRTKDMSKKEMMDYILKDSASAMKEAATGLALISAPRLGGSLSREYSKFTYDKTIEAHREEVFDGKKSVAPRDLRIAVDAQIEHLWKSKAKNAKEQQAKDEEINFLTENKWNEDAISGRYNIPVGEEIDPNYKNEFTIVTDAINGNNQRLVRYQGTEQKPDESFELLPPVETVEGKKEMVPEKTYVQLDSLTDEQRALARDQAIDYLDKNMVKTRAGEIKAPYNSLPNLVQEDLQRHILKNPDKPIKEVMDDYFDGIKNYVFWEGGLPGEEGADFDVWFGATKRSHKMSDLPSQLELNGLNYKTVGVAAFRHPGQPKGLTHEIRQQIKHATRNADVKINPDIKLEEVDPSASTDLKPGDQNLPREQADLRKKMLESISDYEYVSASGSRIKSTTPADGALYHGVQKYKIDPKNGDLILEPFSHGNQYGINFSEEPVVAMFNAEQDKAGQRKKPTGVRIVRIDPGANVDLALVQQNYQELFSKKEKVRIPKGQYTVFEAKEKREVSESRLEASKLPQDFLVEQIISGDETGVYEDELVRRIKTNRLNLQVDQALVEPLNDILDKFRLQGRLDKALASQELVPDVGSYRAVAVKEELPAKREPATPETIQAIKEGRLKELRKRSWIGQLPRTTQILELYNRDDSVRVRIKRVDVDRATATATAHFELEGSVQKVEEKPKSEFPDGVVPRGKPLQQKDVTVAKLNQLRRMSDKAGRLRHIPVRVLKGDRQTATDGTQMTEQNKHFHAAKITAKRNAIYVQEEAMEKLWDEYRTRATVPPVFDPNSEHDIHWLVAHLPAGLDKFTFYSFIVEHERVHLATGIDGTKFDEMLTSIIAFERLGWLEHADELQSKMFFPDRAKYRDAQTEYVQKAGRNNVIVKGFDFKQSRVPGKKVEAGVEDVPAIPQREKQYSKTGVDFIDAQLEQKYTRHPEVDRGVRESAGKVRSVQARMGVETDYPATEEQIEAHGYLDIVEGFIKQHNLESNFFKKDKDGNERGATMEEVIQFANDLNPYLRDELIERLKSQSHAVERVSKLRLPFTRGIKSSAELFKGIRQPKSVFELVEKDEAGRPLGLNENTLAEAELTIEESRALDMKRDLYERRSSYDRIRESIQEDIESLERMRDFKTQELQEKVNNGEIEVDSSRHVSRVRTIDGYGEKIQDKQRQLLRTQVEEQAVIDALEKEYQAYANSLPNGALARVEITWRREHERNKQIEDRSKSERKLQEALENEEVDPEQAWEEWADETRADGDEWADADQDFFGGLFPKAKPIKPTVTPGETAPSQQLGEHSHLLKFFLRINQMNFAKMLFGGEKGLHDIEKRAHIKSMMENFKEYKGGVVEKVILGERSEQYVRLLAGMTHDRIAHHITEYVDSKIPMKWYGRSFAARKLRGLYNALLVRAAEEVKAGSRPGKVVLTNIGVGGKHGSIEEAQAHVMSMERISLELGMTQDEVDARKSLWSKSRAKMNYFNLLPPELQDLVTWWVHVQKEWLDTQVAEGIYDAQNIYKLEQEGYFKRKAEFSLIQQPAENPVRRGALGSNREASRGDLRTYDDYFMDSKRTDMFPSEEFATLAGQYIGDSTRRLQRHQLIKIFSNMPGPNGLNLVMFTDDVVGMGKAKREDVQKYLNEQGYIQLKRGAGLAEHYNGGFKVPFVHRSVYDIYEQLILDRERSFLLDAPLGFAAGAAIGGYVGTPFGPVGTLAGGALGGALGATGGFNTINFVLKRVITFFSHVFVAQTTANAAMWQAEIDNPAKVFYEWMTDLASVYTRGWKRGVKVLKGTDRPYSSLVKNGYEAEKLMLLTKHGMPGLTMDWHMKALFDRTIDSKHPDSRPIVENIKEWFNTKGGIDKVAFENVISKWVYKLASQIYDMEYAKGWSAETAARRAAVATADMNQIMNTWSYGQEAGVLQAFMFARDNTVALLRQGYGVFAPMIDNIPGVNHGFTVGKGSILNTVMHGKESKSDVFALAPYYLNNLGKIFFWNTFAMNMIQYAWIMAQGDDDDKKAPFAWQNPGSILNKFRVRTPYKQDVTGRPVYIDSMVLREVRYYVQAVKETGRFMGSRMSWALGAVIDIADNKDIFGTMVSNPYPMTFNEQLDSFFNRAKFIASKSIPSGGMGDVLPDASTGMDTNMERYLAWAGFTLVTRDPETPGNSFEVVREVRKRQARLAYYQDQIMAHLREHPNDIWEAATKGIDVDGEPRRLSADSLEIWLQSPQAKAYRSIGSILRKEALLNAQVPEERNARFFNE